MGLVKMPAVGDYWSEEDRYEPIADIGRNRFYKLVLPEVIHVYPVTFQ